MVFHILFTECDFKGEFSLCVEYSSVFLYNNLQYMFLDIWRRKDDINTTSLRDYHCKSKFYE